MESQKQALEELCLGEGSLKGQLVTMGNQQPEQQPQWPLNITPFYLWQTGLAVSFYWMSLYIPPHVILGLPE